MQYFVTIYIDILFEKDLLKLDVTHAFLGLSHIHPDELDKQDEQTRKEKLNRIFWTYIIGICYLVVMFLVFDTIPLR